MQSATYFTQELVEHRFWQTRLQLLDLPAEPALEAFIELHRLALSQEGTAAASQVCGTRQGMGRVALWLLHYSMVWPGCMQELQKGRNQHSAA